MDDTMVNQQGKVDLDLAWLAGFIDGEGCFMFRKTASNRLRAMGLVYYYPAIRICNTDQASLQVVSDILDTHHLPYHVTHRAPPKNKDWAAAWDVEVHGMKRCRIWLPVITPYLYTKRELAELMLEFCESRLSSIVGEGYNAREAAILQHFGCSGSTSLTDYTARRRTKRRMV